MRPSAIALALLLPFAAFGQERDHERIVLRLNYFHQFQYAGYYAADWKGYYAEEGLAVDIRELEPGRDHLDLDATDFAIIATPIFERWSRGSDDFLVAIFHQRNPYTVLVHEDSPLRTVQDLLAIPRERLVGPAATPESLLWAQLIRAGVDPNTFFPRAKAPGDIDRFARREIDILPSYRTNEPMRLRRMGVATRELDLGERSAVLFGDALMCRGSLWRSRSDLVERMRRASLRGWTYALRHREEIIDHILAARPSAHQRNDRIHLIDEAGAVAQLIEPDVIPIGEVNLDRLREAATVLSALGMRARLDESLVWQGHRGLTLWLKLALAMLPGIAVAALVLALVARRQHRRLQESGAHYHHLVELAQGYFAFRIRLTPDGFVPELASPSIEQVLGHPLSWYQEHPERLFVQLRPRDRRALAAAVKRTLEHGHALRYSLLVKHANGGDRHLMVHALPSRTERGLIADGICLDLTPEAEATAERMRLQRQLEQAQRHESLGLLAGGVAHDFNNLLGAIRGNAELLRGAVDGNATMQGRWERLMMAVDRAAGLVRQILAYTGKAAIEARPLDLEKELTQLCSLLKHGLPPDIDLKVAIQPDLEPVLFDPVQFQQVVLNLIVNAAESYAGRPGDVTISLVRHGERGVLLRVSDLGCGMDQSTMTRMFEPYFTTKPHGHGLGLAAVRGIIDKAGGRIECHSAIGKGTTFSLELNTLSPEEITASGRYRTPLPGEGAGLVLVVDDDDLMREATVAMLRELGHRVRECARGREAQDLVAAGAAPIAAMVIDCRMPDVDGVTLLRRIRAMRMRFPVVLVSGYPLGEDIRRELADGRTRFLPKPFTTEQLAQILSTLQGPVRERGDDSSSFAIVDEWVRHRKWSEHGREIRKAGGG